MRKLACLRCAALMSFIKREKIQLGQTGLFLGDLPNLVAGSLELDIYSCSRCGKIEFFQPETVEAGSCENLSGSFGPDAGQHIVGVSGDGIPQVRCPSCGKCHDFDYPKCPCCDFDYNS